MGGLTGTSGDLVVNRFRTRRAAVLLAYLAVNKSRSHPRSELVEMLWPEADEDAGRARLRLALASLRKQFEPPESPKGSVIEVIGDSLRLNPRVVSTDVEEFESLLISAEASEDPVAKKESLEGAAAIYRGEFLPGYLEDWVVDERARLSTQYENLLQRLIELYGSQGNEDQALAVATKLIAVDPWRESAHCLMMQIFIDKGNPRAALRQFAALREALNELGEEPSREARKLEQAARDLPLVIAKTGEAGKSAEERMHLPARLTRFFGRQSEISLAIQRLQSGPGPLVTLVGPGGAGKTRLSIEIGYAMVEEGWNVWFVGLADVGASSRIYDAIQTSLKVGKGQDAVEDLSRFFQRQEKTLLILDNLEHLMDEAAGFVGRLLAAAPNLRCIVTSRQRLAIEEEIEVAVPPLPIPRPEDVSVEVATLSPSVQLYVDRCQTNQPGFELSARNAGPIATLCARLEGIPLAIEIAAALARSLSPTQLLERLDSRLDVLISPRRDITDRHKTLRNTIDYSYQLLPPHLAQFFLTLSVFRGGWSIESAEAICLPTLGPQPESCLSLLDQLRERSLVETYETPTGEMRFRMLETFREFARDLISESTKEQIESAADAYYLSLTDAAVANMGTPKEQGSLARLQAEYDNLVHIFAAALERKDVEFGYRFARGFGPVWRSRGAVVYERDIMEAFVNLPESTALDSLRKMQGLNLLSHANFLLCDWERSLAAERRTLAIAESEGNDEFMAVAYGGIALAQRGLRQVEEALGNLAKAVEHARKSGKENRMALLLGNLGFLHWHRGDLALAEIHFREALAIAKRNGAEAQVNFQNLNIIRVLLDENRLDEAMEILPGCLSRSMELHRAHDGIVALSLMARYYRLVGEGGQAWALLQIAIERVLPLMNRGSEQYVAIEAGLELAESHRFGESLVMLASLQKEHLSIGDRLDIERAMNFCRESLSAQEFNRNWALGMTQGIGDTLRSLQGVAYALAG